MRLSTCTCDFVCGTMTSPGSSLRWSVRHNQVTFECHFGRGVETYIGVRCLVYWAFRLRKLHI